ncbi:MAG: hypothetical protein AB7L91_19090 [Dehalococcoidia bacterium]
MAVNWTLSDGLKVTVLGIVGFMVLRTVTGALGLTSIQKQIPS